jgi:hypothetical protein
MTKVSRQQQYAPQLNREPRYSWRRLPRAFFVAQRFYGFNDCSLSLFRATSKKNRRDEHLVETFAHAVGAYGVLVRCINREKCHRAFS